MVNGAMANQEATHAEVVRPDGFGILLLTVAIAESAVASIELIATDDLT